MKKLLFLCLALVLTIALLPMTAQAAEVASGTCGDDLSWTLDDMGNLTITGTGEMDDFTSYTIPWKEHISNIITLKIEEGVTSIGDNAFSGIFQLLEISLPSTLDRIGGYAFSGCSLLSEVVIPDSVTTIGDNAFSGCSDLSTINIPKSAVTIGQYAFSCENLKTVYYNATCADDRDQEHDMFYDAGSESGGFRVIIGANVTRIPANMFATNVPAIPSPPI